MFGNLVQRDPCNAAPTLRCPTRAGWVTPLPDSSCSSCDTAQHGDPRHIQGHDRDKQRSSGGLGPSLCPIPGHSREHGGSGSPLPCPIPGWNGEHQGAPGTWVPPHVPSCTEAESTGHLGLPPHTPYWVRVGNTGELGSSPQQRDL